MPFIFTESGHARHKYGKLGPGPIVAASPIKVYKDEKLVRMETKDGRRIHRKVDGHDADIGMVVGKETP